MPSCVGPEPKSNAIELVSLCCSLNSPVVSIPELPVGPASAAIAIHTDADEGSHITVAVQCRRTGDVVLFRSQGGSGGSVGAAGRSALLWAEGMGFLFDEELCTDPGIETGVRNKLATEIWRELTREWRRADSVAEARDGSAEAAEKMVSKFRIHRAAWSGARPEMPGTNRRWELTDLETGPCSPRVRLPTSSLEPQDRNI